MFLFVHLYQDLFGWIGRTVSFWSRTTQAAVLVDTNVKWCIHHDWQSSISSRLVWWTWSSVGANVSRQDEKRLNQVTTGVRTNCRDKFCCDNVMTVSWRFLSGRKPFSMVLDLYNCWDYEFGRYVLTIWRVVLTTSCDNAQTSVVTTTKPLSSNDFNVQSSV